MNPEMIRQVPRVNVREPFDSSRWNLYANWMNGDKAMFATLPDMDGATLVGIDPEDKTVSLAGGAVLIDATSMDVTVPATFDAALVANAAVTLGDAAGDAISIQGTSTFSAPATFNAQLTATASVTLGDAAADALLVNATSTFASPATFNAAVVMTAAVTLGDALADPITINGTTTWTGFGQRILGDLTSSPHTNRLLFQTTIANSPSALGVLPSGSGTTGGINFYNTSDPANASVLQVQSQAAQTIIASNQIGTGTALPLRLQFNGTTRIEVNTTGIGAFGVTPVARQSIGAAATDAATTQTLANAIRTALINLGWCQT